MVEYGFRHKNDAFAAAGPWITPEPAAAASKQNESQIQMKSLIAQKQVILLQLAEMTGIKQHHISEMENHKRSIGKKNAVKLAEALNIGYKVFL